MFVICLIDGDNKDGGFYLNNKCLKLRCGMRHNGF
jgi:hypothetical protein